MSSTVDRYDLVCNDYNDFSMNKHIHGDYVEYCDYEELEKKYDYLVSRITDLYRSC